MTIVYRFIEILCNDDSLSRLKCNFFKEIMIDTVKCASYIGKQKQSLGKGSHFIPP